MMYKKILVAYDGSDHAKEAVHTALELAKQELAQEVHVLGVIESYMAGVAFGNPAGISPDLLQVEITDNQREEFKQKILDLVKDYSIVPSTEIILGIPKDTIIEVAKDQEVDLIIMGSRGLGPVRGLLGSVSYGVLSHADVPVLIVR